VLSELQGGAGVRSGRRQERRSWHSGPAEVEKDVEEHRYSLVLEAQEVGLFAQRYRVDQQPRTPDRRAGELG
jgi:hypothetical protein